MHFIIDICIFCRLFNMFKKYQAHYKSNLKLAIPVVISQLGHTLVSFSDSIIVGQFAGTVPLAAVSLGSSIFMVFMVFGIGISYGLTPLIAQEDGKRNYYACGRLLAHSLIINVITGVLLFSCIYFGSVYIIDHLDQAPAVAAQTKPFLNLLGFSIIPLMVFLTFKQFAEGLGFTKQAMQISIWGNVLNIIVGIILVKGMFGISPMGVVGVGYSTLTDRFLMAFVMVVYVFNSHYFKRYIRSFSLSGFLKKKFRRIVNLGAPVALQYIFEISAFSGAAILIGWMGAAELAAHQIAINLAAMTYMMASGISAAAGIKSGNNFGRRDFRQLRLSAISNYHIVIGFMLITAVIFIGFHQFLPYLYSNDPEVIGMAAGLLIITGFFQLFDGTQVVGLGILRGMSDVKIPTLITFFAYWILGLPVGYLLAFHFNLGIYGIWWGLLLGLLAASLLLYFRFEKKSKDALLDEIV